MELNIFILLVLLSLLGCGVKGDPQPPAEMPTLGRGRPTFDKASKELLQKEKQRSQKPSANEENKKK